MKFITMYLLLISISFSQVQKQIDFSSIPTPAELKVVFTKTKHGEYTAIEALRKIVERKDKAIPALQYYLNVQIDSIKRNDFDPSKIYAVLALEAIGTKQSYEVLTQLAINHSEAEVRGTALKTLSNSYYSRVVEDSLKPNKDIVHILLNQCDDTTYVNFCHKRIGDIAREGIKNWLGVDYGELSLNQSKITLGKEKVDLNPNQYREWW